ncbi:hypothetical protein KHQ82_07320 [Mycoplasmatota bacterium]|nr:hypothetical protein KHQ82_07320 [Mycoplasmatota bacterium]
MRSHVIVPKSFIKQWAYKKDGKFVIEYFDISKKKYCLEEVGKLFTAEDYYSPELEKFLSDKIEAPFRILRTELSNFLSKKGVLKISKKRFKKIRIAFDLLTLRNNYIVDDLNNMYKEDFGIQGELTLPRLLEFYNNNPKESNITQGLTFMPVKNESSHQFILSPSYMMGVVVHKSEGTVLFLPLTPVLGIIFTNVPEFVKQALDAKIMYIESDSLADWLNNSMVSSEMLRGSYKCIIGCKKSIQSVLGKRIDKEKII